MMILQGILVLALAAYGSAVSGGMDVQDADAPMMARLSGAGMLDAFPSQFGEIVSITVGAAVVCQGSLIAKNMTITAASCFWTKSDDSIKAAADITLNFGQLDKTAASATTTQTQVATGLIINPGFRYYPATKVFENDLALITHNDVVMDGNPIQAIPIPKKEPTGTVGVLASWGNVEDTADPPGAAGVAGGNPLKFTVVPVLDNKVCEKDVTLLPYVVPKEAICTDITTKKGYCVGDGGAGLRQVDTKTDIPYLVGVASVTTDTNCPPKKTNVYTRITPYLKWIETSKGPKAQ